MEYRNYLRKYNSGKLQNYEPLSPKDALLPSLVEIGPVDLEKKSKKGKVYRKTDR